MAKKTNNILWKRFFKTSFCHNGQLNKRGEGLVSIEARQHTSRVYFSTHIYLKPEQFKNGLVINHPNANQLNVVLNTIKAEIEAVELDYILKGRYITVRQLKVAYNEKCTPTALLIDFGREVINNSERKQTTKDGYEVLFNNLNKFREGTRISDVDYNYIVAYNNWLKDCGIMQNTIIGRLQQLKTIISEGYKRDVIKENPFNKFKIPTMSHKQGFLTEDELNTMSKLKLNGKEKIARDAFLFSCYTGLRYSDVVSLKQNEINDNWIHKTMVKTQKPVDIPLVGLFDDKPLQIIEEYHGNIENLGRKMGQCGGLNQHLKKVFEKAGIGKENNFTYHTSRHTCASLLMQKGIPMTTVSKILGHCKISTTQIYAEVTKDVISNDIKKIGNRLRKK